MQSLLKRGSGAVRRDTNLTSTLALFIMLLAFFIVLTRGISFVEADPETLAPGPVDTAHMDLSFASSGASGDHSREKEISGAKAALKSLQEFWENGIDGVPLQLNLSEGGQTLRLDTPLDLLKGEKGKRFARQFSSVLRAHPSLALVIWTNNQPLAQDYQLLFLRYITDQNTSELWGRIAIGSDKDIAKDRLRITLSDTDTFGEKEK